MLFIRKLGFLFSWAEEEYGGYGTGWRNGVFDILPDFIMMEELAKRSVVGVFSTFITFKRYPIVTFTKNKEN